ELVEWRAGGPNHLPPRFGRFWGEKMQREKLRAEKRAAPTGRCTAQIRGGRPRRDAGQRFPAPPRFRPCEVSGRGPKKSSPVPLTGHPARRRSVLQAGLGGFSNRPRRVEEARGSQAGRGR